jgi:hypothetical protein
LGRSLNLPNSSHRVSAREDEESVKEFDADRVHLAATGDEARLTASAW